MKTITLLFCTLCTLCTAQTMRRALEFPVPPLQAAAWAPAARVMVSNPNYARYWQGRAAAWRYDVEYGDPASAFDAALVYLQSHTELTEGQRNGIITDRQDIQLIIGWSEPPATVPQ